MKQGNYKINNFVLLYYLMTLLFAQGLTGTVCVFCFFNVIKQSITFAIFDMYDKVRWDEIVSIEVINDYPYRYVYDFSVQDIENFTLSNGLVVHNTLDTFHLSGVANKCNINQGVPRIRELISATKVIKTPSMKLYLPGDARYQQDQAKQLVHKSESIELSILLRKTSILYWPDLSIESNK